MRNYTYLLTSLVVCSLLFACTAEKKMAQKGFYKERYNLVIPPEWQKKPATIDIVTEVLEKTLVQLKGKDFCFNCQAPYTVALEIDNFEKIAQTAVERVFVFDARLVLSDTAKKRISSLLLLSRNEDELVYYNVPSRPTHDPVVSGALYNGIRDVEMRPKELLHTVSKNPDNAIRTGQVNYGNAYKQSGKEKFRLHNIDESIINKFILEKLTVLKGHLDNLEGGQ